MDRDKIIILALIVIIGALLVGIFAMMPNTNKQDTNLTFESNSTLDEGDSLKIKLTDVNGTAIANQTVNITVTDENSTSDYHSVVTDSEGVGKLKLDKDPGKYNVTISYGGNDNYSDCNASQKLTIKEKEKVEATVSQSSTQSSSSSTHKIIGEDGYYYIIDDNGNFLETLGPSSKAYPNDPNGVYYPDAEPSGRYIDKGN